MEILIQRIHQNAAKPQDLMALYNWTTFDLISDPTFGEPFDCLQHQRYHPWVTTFLENINGGVAVSAAERYGLGSLLVALIPKSMKESFALIFEHTKGRIVRRSERGTERQDFMSHWLRNNKDGKEMSQSEIEENAMTIIVAGSETTASLLSAVSHHVMMNPEMLRGVSEEVRTAFPLSRRLIVPPWNSSAT